MQIYMIAAVDETGCIGVDGKLPWHYPEDLAAFKQLTTGHVVIMGRKTYESLPDAFRPLPDRINIVLSRFERENECRWSDDHYVSGSLDTALKWCVDKEPIRSGRVFIAGGAEVYKSAMQFADMLYLTHVPGQHAGDTFFPEWPINKKNWRHTSTIDRNGLRVSFYANLRER